MEKIKTGIIGFDELVQGGIPKGALVLLSGSPGTGKTLFSLEYIYNGAKNNEKGLYVSFEESIDSLKVQASQFGWDFNNEKIAINSNFMHINSKRIDHTTISSIINYIQQNNINRLVIDSISTLALNVPTIHTKSVDITDFTIKRFIYHFLEELKTLKNTTTIVNAHVNNKDTLSNDEISEFIADGIIHIIYESLGGEFSRSLTIRKMRQCKNDEDIHPLEISEKGIIIHTLE